MDKFLALQVFVAVVDSGGFSPAARRLGLVTSSLTRQVNALEKNLGTLLINRSTRSISLTESGTQYYHDARRILDELDQADQNIIETNGPPQGLLKVTMPTAFGRLHFAPILINYAKLYPKIKLDLQLTDINLNLVEEGIDIALRFGTTPPSNVIARKIAPLHRVICASPSYLDNFGTPSEPEDLLQHNCLLFDYKNGQNVWSLHKGNKKHRVSVSGNLLTNNSEVLKEAAIAGMGLILMPTWLVGEELSSQKLVKVLDEWSATSKNENAEIWALYLQNKRGSKKIKTFLDFLTHSFGSPPYWDTQ